MRTTLRTLTCDAWYCMATVQSVEGMYRLTAAAQRQGWSIGSGRRAGVDYCPDHAAPSRRRLTEPAE